VAKIFPIFNTIFSHTCEKYPDTFSIRGRFGTNNPDGSIDTIDALGSV
jgi:hypothetical protein